MMNRRAVGKLSVIFLLLLMMNTVGFIVIKTEIDMENPYVQESTPLARFYVPRGEGYGLTEEGALYQSVPTQASDDIISGFLDFVDRILVTFKFLRAVIEFALVPGTLLAIMGLPWQIAMILEVFTTIFIILGLIDIIAGGDS